MSRKPRVVHPATNLQQGSRVGVKHVSHCPGLLTTSSAAQWCFVGGVSGRSYELHSQSGGGREEGVEGGHLGARREMACIMSDSPLVMSVLGAIALQHWVEGMKVIGSALGAGGAICLMICRRY